MLAKQATVLLLLLPLCLAKSADVTFKNVTFRGYSVYVEKFKKVIPWSNSLKDFMPESAFDQIEFVNEYIPMLYEDSLADLDDLDELVFENCSVKEIRPRALRNVPLLRRLSLKGNELEEIKAGTFNNLQLSTLDLSKNRIKTIASSAFDDMPSLLTINLADNRIAAWNPSWFQNTPLLSRISMQNNSIAAIPSSAFQHLKGTKKFGKVDLSLNLIFSYNKIQDVHPRAFEGLTKMNNLWLDHNALEDFGEDALDGIVVSELRLNYNKIKCLEGDYRKLFAAASTQLDGNPLECNCLEEMKAWAKSNGKNVGMFYADMECMTQRIRRKMTALEERIKEIRAHDDGESEIVDMEPSAKKPLK